MKKYFIGGLLCLAYTLSASAQDGLICGDWGGVYTDYNGRNIKMVISLKANGKEYLVRLKQVYCNGEVKYDDFAGYTFHVSYSNSDSTLIYWNKFEREINQKGQNADGDEYERTDVYRRYSVKIKGGEMTFKSWYGYDRMYEPSYEPGYVRLSVDREHLITRTLIKGDTVASFSEICKNEKIVSVKTINYSDFHPWLEERPSILLFGSNMCRFSLNQLKLLKKFASTNYNRYVDFYSVNADVAENYKWLMELCNTHHVSERGTPTWVFFFFNDYNEVDVEVYPGNASYEDLEESVDEILKYYL